MRISEVVQHLQELQEAHGDLWVENADGYQATSIEAAPAADDSSDIAVVIEF